MAIQSFSFIALTHSQAATISRIAEQVLRAEGICNLHDNDAQRLSTLMGLIGFTARNLTVAKDDLVMLNEAYVPTIKSGTNPLQLILDNL